MAATALSTDLYQLTMVAGYVASNRQDRVVATFELFTRSLPDARGYLVAAGLESVLEYLERLRFESGDIEWLRGTSELRHAPETFFEYLRGFRFTGDVSAVAEGTPVFADEPMLQVTAPLPQAQLVETALLSFVNFQTSVASKASRVVTAADGRPVMEFGARRAHGPEAAVLAARAAYLAGCRSTSYVAAGRRFGIPLSGTMAHSWVLAAKSEADAFREYAAMFGGGSTLLLDTFDTEAAARSIVSAGLRPAAVRLDSGDLLALSRSVRAVFDGGGLRETKIIASGDLDEYRIRGLLDARAPIDAFGIGTSVVTSIDAPALGGVYKLVELRDGNERRRVMKHSPGKPTWPGRKQVWRVLRDGIAVRDVVSFHDEPEVAGATALLRPVMRSGVRVDPSTTLDASRSLREARLAELPADVRRLVSPAAYPVDVSGRLRDARTDSAPRPAPTNPDA
jgi:nicotinate phosphoribosyltransferase